MRRCGMESPQTYALDTVADVFAGLCTPAAGLQILAARPLPRWLGWLAVAASPFLFLQAFGLGGASGPWARLSRAG